MKARRNAETGHAEFTAPFCRVAAAVLGAAVVGGVAANSASSKAAKAQKNAADAGIANSKDQFGQVQALLAPYVKAGNEGTDAQRALLGLAGTQAQTDAVNGIQNGGQFQAMAKSGEDAIVQNASATGGLRGGNVQAALGQFRPQLLNTLINQRFAQLGDVATRGQASAAGQATIQGQNAGQIAQLLGNVGQAQAGAALGQGAAISGAVNGVGAGVGTYLASRPTTGAPAAGAPYYIAAPTQGATAAPAAQPQAAPYYLSKF